MKKDCIAIVGMNGAGKTALGKKLSAKVQMKRIDTDAVFRDIYGDEHNYIMEHGWKSYRAKESEIVLQSLKPGNLVIVSGGGLDAKRVRRALSQNAVVIWLRMPLAQVTKNLKNAKKDRPEFTIEGSARTVDEVFTYRQNFYEQLADITLPSQLRFSQHVPFVLEKLKEFIG